MEHRQRKRLRVEELECRRLLHGDFYGPVQLEIESITQQSTVFVSASDGELAVTTVRETNIEGNVLLAEQPRVRSATSHSAGSLLRTNTPTNTLGHSHITDFKSTVTEVERVNYPTGEVHEQIIGILTFATTKGPNGPGVQPALKEGPSTWSPSGQSKGNNQPYAGRTLDTTPDTTESTLGGRGGDSPESSTAAEIAAAEGTLTEANGSEAGDGARRTEAQLRNVPAAPSSQNRALTDSAEAAPPTSAAPYAGRPDSLPQAENDTPPIPDARAESAANEPSTEDTAPSMKLASAVWFALGQLPVAAALEPLRPEGPALVQDLLYADWDAVEDAIDEMLMELRTGIAGVTPQNVRDAVFASSAAVLAAFAGEAARRRQQRLKDEELLALAFDADGHLALA